MSVRVAVVGFGYVGACVGAVLAGKKYDVVGIDTRPEVVDAVNRGETVINEPGLGDLVRQSVADGHLRAATDIAETSEADVILITVGTPMVGDAPDTTQVESVCRELKQHIVPGQLVILKSTVPPFTTEEKVRPILEASGMTAGEDFFLAFCPERLAEGRALQELQVLPVVVGGVGDESTERAARFWEDALGLETIRVANARTAEMSKLADNLWIDLSIAIGNELALLSDRLDIDVLEVIAAANSLPKGKHHVNILMPSVGVGGSCLTKDPWFVDHMARDRGLSLSLPAAGRKVNETMPANSVAMIIEELEAAGKDLQDSTIAVLGLAFKDNTGDVRLTPTKPVVELLEESGCELRVIDPLVTEEDIASITSVTPSKSIEDAIRGADCVAFLTGHDDFRRLTVEDIVGAVSPGGVVFDGRMYFSRSQIEAFQGAGLRYRGIGR